MRLAALAYTIIAATTSRDAERLICIRRLKCASQLLLVCIVQVQGEGGASRDTTANAPRLRQSIKQVYVRAKDAFKDFRKRHVDNLFEERDCLPQMLDATLQLVDDRQGVPNVLSQRSDRPYNSCASRVENGMASPCRYNLQRASRQEARGASAIFGNTLQTFPMGVRRVKPTVSRIHAGSPVCTVLPSQNMHCVAG